MRTEDFKNLTGYPPDSIREAANPSWCPEGFADGFKEALGLSVPEALYQRAMLEFPGEWLPTGFPGGMSVGRALLEAREEFLSHAEGPTLERGGAYRVNESELAVYVGLTSLGRPCAMPSMEELDWLLGSVAVLADAPPRMVEEGRSAEEGAGGTLIRNYTAQVSPDARDQARLLELFRPDGARGVPKLPENAMQALSGMRVVNSRTHGIGLLNPGEPYWDYMHDPGLESLQVYDSARLGLGEYPLVVEFATGPVPQYAWLPFSEIACVLRVRLEVVLRSQVRHRAAVLTSSIPADQREELPNPMILVSMDYVSPLEYRGDGLDGPMLGGVSYYAGYGLDNRAEILGLVGEFPHRELKDSTRVYLEMARSKGL